MACLPTVLLLCRLVPAGRPRPGGAPGEPDAFHYDWAAQLARVSPNSRVAALGAMTEDDRLAVQVRPPNAKCRVLALNQCRVLALNQLVSGVGRPAAAVVFTLQRRRQQSRGRWRGGECTVLAGCCRLLSGPRSVFSARRLC